MDAQRPRLVARLPGRRAAACSSRATAAASSWSRPPAASSAIPAGYSAYCPSKAAVDGLTKSLACEWGRADHGQRDRADRVPLRPDGVDVRRRGPRQGGPRGHARAHPARPPGRAGRLRRPADLPALAPPRRSSPGRSSTSTAATRRADGLERIAVIGAGLMGHGLAQVFAAAGPPSPSTTRYPDALAPCRERVAANLEALGRGIAARRAYRARGDLAEAVCDADWVFEAAPEQLELKQHIFAAPRTSRRRRTRSSRRTPPSSRVGRRSRERVAEPDRVVGTHWWNPPYLVPARRGRAGGAHRARGRRAGRSRLLERVGKRPVHVRRDVPGFVGNRLQHALWREAFALVADGVCDAETVDLVVKIGLRPCDSA